MKTVSASYDPIRREERLAMDGTAHMNWINGWYETDGLTLGYRADFTRDPSPQQSAPSAVVYPSSDETESKLIVSYLVGGRDAEYAMWFMDDLRERLANHVQLNSDGHRAYLKAVEGAFGADVDMPSS